MRIAYYIYIAVVSGSSLRPLLQCPKMSTWVIYIHIIYVYIILCYVYIVRRDTGVSRAAVCGNPTARINPIAFNKVLSTVVYLTPCTIGRLLV